MSLDMTLDDIIATKQKQHSRSGARNGKTGKSGRGRSSRKGSGGAERSAGKARAARTSAAPYRPFAQQQEDSGDGVIWGLASGGNGPGAGAAGSRLTSRRTDNGGSGILSRLGSKMNSSGTKVTVGNLGFDVLEAELKELFETVGELLDAKVKYDRTGRSLGEGEVTFARQSDAVEAVKKFHARALDGMPMQVKLSGVDGKDNPLNPYDSTEVSIVNPQTAANAKSQIFGTALKTNASDGRRGGKGKLEKEPTFSVILSQKGGRGKNTGGRGGGKRNGGRGKGQRRNENKGGRGRGPITEADLNAEMEAYMETS